MANTITRASVIEKAIATEGIFTDEELEVLASIRKSFNRKSQPSKARVAEVEKMTAMVRDYIAEHPGHKAKEIAVGLDLYGEDGTPATQKVAAYAKKLVDAGIVERRKEKKDTRFYLIGEEDRDEEA